MLGFISPSVVTVPSDLEAMLPSGVRVAITTLSVRNGVAGEPERAVAAIEGAVEQLVYESAQAVITFGIPLAARRGFAEEQRAYGALSAANGVPVTSSLMASIAWLNEVRKTRTLSVTQYNPEANAQIARYFAAAGANVIASAGLGAANAAQVNALSPDDYYALAKSALAEHPSADSLFLAGRGMLNDVAQRLERETGLPVVHQYPAAFRWALAAISRR